MNNIYYSIKELADIIKTLGKPETDGTGGINIDGYYLTPGTCYIIAKAIKEVNNIQYGAGHWELDKPVIKMLEEATRPVKK